MQGDLGELSAIDWLGEHGYTIYVPLGHSPDCNLIANDGQNLLRAQVKTTTQHHNGRRWLIPATAVEASTAVVLGGPKYAQFEVEAGRPLSADVTP